MAPTSYHAAAGTRKRATPAAPEGSLDKRVPPVPCRLLVAAVIQFYGGDDTSGPKVIQDEIHMLLTEPSALRSIPQFIGAFQNIGQPGFKSDAACGAA
jgi:hypothetical protein